MLLVSREIHLYYPLLLNSPFNKYVGTSSVKQDMIICLLWTDSAAGFAFTILVQDNAQVLPSHQFANHFLQFMVHLSNLAQMVARS